MSGENGKSWKIEIMPPWLMWPCCMLAPSSTASSPVCMPPLRRASNGFAPPPVETPGMRIAKPADERGRPAVRMGSWARVPGAMPSTLAPVS